MKKSLTLAAALLSCGYSLCPVHVARRPRAAVALVAQQQGPRPCSKRRHASAGAPLPGSNAPALPDNQPTLTLAQAEQLAIRNNPRISVAKLTSLAQHEITLEARSAELPTANAAATAVQAEEASRLSAGSLTASRLLQHVGGGANFTQLIYDFGHTHNLVLSRKLEEKASNASALATTEEIVLATDQAFYDALIAQAELEVAKQTVNARQTTENQVGAMTRNKLKSTLDLSFADVDLSQGQLLQLDAQNNADAAMAALDAVLGLDHSVEYALVEDHRRRRHHPRLPSPSSRPRSSSAPICSLLPTTRSRRRSSRALSGTSSCLSMSAAGTAGIIPVHPGTYYITNWWGAIGGNINIPVFNGFLYVSEAKEARYRAQAASENSRDLRDRIVRDVRTSWLQANMGWQRMAVTAQLVKQANLAMDLAQTHYKLGLSSIVELSQAQLQQTSAQIQDTSARYQYRLSLATLHYEIGATP